MNYDEFIANKQTKIEKSGFTPEKLNDHLFPFQKHCVTKALEAGRYAIFSDCGTGKTIMQLEWAHQVAIKTSKPVLILCPLAVSGQTIQEGAKFGIEVERWTKGMEAQATLNHLPMIMIANYEKLENIDVSIFIGVVLDESSILKNFTGKYKTLIIEQFANTPYKLACTATPAPNDPMELGNHTEFLNVMSRVEMLAMYFIHDASDTSKWRLKGHAIKEFYKFIGSWATMLRTPKDIGFEDKGYELPPLNMDEFQIETERSDNGKLFNDVSVSATNFNQELRRSKVERLQKAAEIANSTCENYIVWVKQNEEANYLKTLIPDAVEVRGNDKPEVKEARLLGFANNEFRVLITKAKIAQFGLNYQNCRNQIFASLDFSFEGLYQAIRRSYRFGQKNEVNISLITTDTMQNVIGTVNEKKQKFEEMHNEMTQTINENTDKAVSNFNIESEENEYYKVAQGDSFRLIRDVESESIDTSIFSPPFSSLYTYSDNAADLSNCLSHDQFYQQFSYMVPELFRITKPGRHVGMHLTQLTTGIAKDGHYSIIDFRGEIIRLFQKAGFLFHAEVTIWKDPQLAAIRTKNHQLMHGSTKKDAAIVRPGLADYLVVLRKPGENAEKINYNGEGIPFERWVKIASPIWMDIRESDTLQYRAGRENDDERHITPTQLTVIENYLIMYSNEGDTVFTPFMGIGSEVYQAVKMNRKGLGFELKESYFQAAKANLKNVVAEKSQLELFA